MGKTTEMVMSTDLLPYQQQAVEKLRHLRVGALYMEMGTGKTRTALELIKIRLNAGKIKHVIWLCPCNIKADIRRGISEHSNLCDLGILDIVGIETLSTSTRECGRLLQLVKREETFLIVDESSLVKNHAALRTIHIQMIANECPYRLILNGTPISRNEADLYSQWCILDWRILGYKSYYSFAANHLEIDDRGRVRHVLNTRYLAKKIAPYTYQVQKKDCFTLPAKNYHVRYCALSEQQNANYDYIIDHLLGDLDEMSNTAIYQLFGALQEVVSGFRIHIEYKGKYKDPHAIRDEYVAESRRNPKLLKLEQLLDEITANEKTIIFCQYTEEINSIVRMIEERGSSAVSFYGEMPIGKRNEAIKKFRVDTQFFVANTSCGAFGLNLQFCHNVIFFSNGWNWGTRAQAEDRVHRLGQTSEVDITDICMFDSIDMQILKCLNKKESLSDHFKNDVSSVQVRDFLHGKEVSKRKDGKNLPKRECVPGDAEKA